MYYGSLSKWVPPCLLEALKVYTQLTPHNSDLLFEGVNGAEFNWKNLLAQASNERYERKYTHMQINLTRKLFHSVLLSRGREEGLLAAMGKVDAHSPLMALRTYTLTSAAKDQKLAALLWKVVYGDTVVAWPDDAARNMYIFKKHSSKAKVPLFLEDMVEEEDDDIADFQIACTDYK